VVAMRLRERAQVDYTHGAVVENDDVDVDLGAGGGLVTRRSRAKVLVKEAVLSDEIEHSESEESDDGEKPEVISDDSSNLEDGVPLATKLQTGRLRRRKVKSKRGAGGRGDEEDTGVGGNGRGRKAAPTDLLLKYLQPNVSNVEDRPNHVSAGYE
jgi:hypothetical protein